MIVGDAYVTRCVTVGCDACDAGGDKGVCSVCDKKNDFSQLGGTVVIDCVGIIQQIFILYKSNKMFLYLSVPKDLAFFSWEG